MSVYIDEVEASVEPEASPKSEETASAPSPGGTDPYHLQMELGHLAQRRARLYAD